MRIHEFGTEHEKTVLLLHSACLSWRMFRPAVERLQTQYHLIIPALPKQLCTAARVSYWYGEKEYSQRALDIRHVRRLLPEAVFVPFPDCAHAEFVSGQPEAFAARLAETLERD